MTVEERHGLAQRLERVLSASLRRYFNVRFHDLHVHMDQGFDAIQQRLGGHPDAAVTSEGLPELVSSVRNFAELFAEVMDEITQDIDEVAGLLAETSSNAPVD